MSLVLGIDMGTSACRIAAVDTDNHVHALVRVPLAPPEQVGDRCEQAPETLWQACTEALGTILRKIPANDVDAIAVDGTSSTLLLCDAKGNPQGNALMYRDQRAKAQAERLSTIAPLNAAVHSPSSSLAKLLWLKDQGELKPGLKALHQGEWLTGRLRGRYDTGDENNALKLGYDAFHRHWPGWLAGCGLPIDCLPKIVPAGTDLGYISPDIARQFGLPSSCRTVAGTTDSTATFLASGAHEVGDGVTVLGSTLVLKICSDRPVFAPEYGIYSHRLGEHWLVGGASNAGGAVLNQYFSNTQLTELSEHIDPTSQTGFDYIPLPGVGERFPVNDPELAPCLSPRPDDDAMFLQGMFEGLARIEQQGYARLAELGAPALKTLRTGGGGAKNPAWSAIRQAMIPTQFLPADHEEAAFGSALLARQARQ